MNESFRRNMLAIILSICGLIVFVYIFVPRAPLDGRSVFSSVVMPNRESLIHPSEYYGECRFTSEGHLLDAYLSKDKVDCNGRGGMWVVQGSLKLGTGYIEVNGTNSSDALTMLSNDLQRSALPVFIIVGGLCLALAIFVYSRRRF